jgi:hypothetical protein
LYFLHSIVPQSLIMERYSWYESEESASD